MLQRKIAPEFKGIDNIDLLKPQHIELDNGCKIFFFNSGDQELVRIEWIFNNLSFNAAKPLLNMAVNTMLTDGTTQLTAAEIADRVDFYGAFLQVDYGFDHSQVTLFSLVKHLASTLPVVKAILTDSVFPAKELETFKRNQQQKLQVNLKKNDVVARRMFNKAVYGNTIYGFGAEATDYDKLDRGDMMLHFKKMYQPGNCTIVIAGKISDETTALISSEFGVGWQNQIGGVDIIQPVPTAIGKHFNLEEKPEALQSAIRIGGPMINRLHPDFPALQVLNTVLGGYFGSRLMANIREDKGYTYGIGSGMSSFKQGGAFFIATEVGAEVCRSAVQEIEKEINILKTELIPDDELSLVRNYMLKQQAG